MRTPAGGRRGRGRRLSGWPPKAALGAAIPLAPAAAAAAAAAASPAAAAAASAAAPGGAAWRSWLKAFGTDAYRYPDFVAAQLRGCSCRVDAEEGLGSPLGAFAKIRRVQCWQDGREVRWSGAAALTWCVARHFLLAHMPRFDLAFLPGSVSVDGESMLDDNIAFALMAWNASKLQPKPPLKLAFSYLLPYATYHEARANWRPLFFARYFAHAERRTSSKEVLESLIAGATGLPALMNWTAHTWPGFPGHAAANRYEFGPFAPGSTPPVMAPFDFTAYGYGSCTGWAKFLASALKAVGVPAREVGSPCWNTGEFRGLARENPSVLACWSGRRPADSFSSGPSLNNHNWVEYWDNRAAAWRFVDVATTSSSQDTWFCGTFANGCSCSSNAGKASRDHDVFAPTWSLAGDAPDLHGGPVLSVARDLRLSTGAPVSPLVWSPALRSPMGETLKDVGLRVVNRTSFYRCAVDEGT